MNEGNLIQRFADRTSETIYQQLAAMDFFAAIKVQSMVSGKGSLTLKFPTKKGANTAVIAYDEGQDLYNIEIHECRILNSEPFIINNHVRTVAGIFFDQMPEVIARELSH